MAKATLKTRKSGKSVSQFIAGIKDPDTRSDCRKLMKIMSRATRARPKMWGPAVVGYGTYRCRYASGRELDWFKAGFSPRKQNLTIYVMSGFKPHKELLRTLGKFKHSKGCLYLKRLADVDRDVLGALVATCFERLDGRTVAP